MSDQSTTTEAPPEPPPPPPVVTDIDIWNPGGDPAALRAAADAWTAMGATLRAQAEAIRTSRTMLGDGWQGPARGAYETHSDEILSTMDEGADGFDTVAAELRHVADEIEDINRQIHEIYVAIAATAVVSIAASFITFGASAVAGAAAATAGAARAASLVRTLASVISVSRLTFTTFKAARFVTVWRNFAIGVGIGTGLTAAGKAAFQQQNPFDLDNWSLKDLRNIIVGGSVGGILSGPAALFGGTLRGALASGAVVGATPGIITDLRDGVALPELVRNAGVNAVFGAGGGYLGFRLGGGGATPATRPGSSGGALDDLTLPGPPRIEVPELPPGTVRGPSGLIELADPPGMTRSPSGRLLVPEGAATPVRPPVVLGAGETQLPSGFVLPSGVRPPAPGGIDLPPGVVEATAPAAVRGELTPAEGLVTDAVTGLGSPVADGINAHLAPDPLRRPEVLTGSGPLANSGINAATDGSPPELGAPAFRPPLEVDPGAGGAPVPGPVLVPEAPVGDGSPVPSGPGLGEVSPVPGPVLVPEAPASTGAPAGDGGVESAPGPFGGLQSEPPTPDGPDGGERGGFAAPADAATAVVRPGEGLHQLADRTLGDPARLQELIALNPWLHDGGALIEGQVVRVPGERALAGV